MNPIILEAKGVQFSYEDGTQALRGVDLRIRRGERLAVMGCNGSGKSTFFLCLNGVHRPQKGSVLLDGSPIAYSAKGLLELRRRVGMVFQDPDCQLFSADVYGEISFGAMNLGLPEAEVRSRVENAMEELGITALAHKPVHFLSGGQKKLVAIADALVMRPDVILLDEPAAALDPYHTQIVDEAIDRLSAKGITVIIATHDVNRAFGWADAVALFDDGRVLLKDTPQRVFADSRLLQQTHLKPPAVLALFDRMTACGMLPAGLAVPRSEAQLLQYLSTNTGQ